MTRRGLTLAEVLVSAGLLLVVLGLAIQVFLPALSAWRRGQARTQVQQSALVAARWIRRDLTQSAPAALRLGDRELVMATAGDPPEFDDLGQPHWRQWVYYWLDDDQQLWREVIPFPAVSEPPASVPADLQPPSRTDPAARDQARVVARGIEAFRSLASPAQGVRFQLTAMHDSFRYELMGGALSVYGTGATPEPPPAP